MFHLETLTGELYKYGIRIKLQEQPFRVLETLLETPGEVVTREQLRKRVWTHDTFVDFDHSLNISINKLRDALSDSAASPRFIETLPRRGYRFVAPVSVDEQMAASAPELSEQSATATANAAPEKAAPKGEPPLFAPEIDIAGDGARISYATGTIWWRVRLPWLIIATLILIVGSLVWSGQSPRSVSSKGRVMLAILPFEDLTRNPQNEFFIAGLHDEMISQLGRLNPARLGVIARTSVLQYSEKHTPLQQIGRELHADYVLEGTVRNVDGKERITAELIKVSDQNQLWVETYQPKMEDILSLQEDVARNISAALSVEFLPESEKTLRQNTTQNADAYEAYLRGRFLWYEDTRQSLEAAIGQFQKSIALDPNYAPAYVGLADTYNIQGGYGLVAPEEVFPKARTAAAKALELAPNLSDAYNSMAFSAFYYDWNWSEAEQLFRRALVSNPNNSVAHEFYSFFLHSMGRLDEAEAENAIAEKLDPQSAWSHDDLGWIFLTRHRPEDAAAEFRKALQLSKLHPSAHLSLAVAYIRLRKFQDALAETRRAEEVGGEATRVLEVRGSALALSGDLAGAQAIVDRLQAGKVSGRVSPYSVALVYAAMGKKSEAIDWLEKASREKDPWTVWIKVLVEWDSLRSDPRFQTLLQGMKL